MRKVRAITITKLVPAASSYTYTFQQGKRLRKVRINWTTKGGDTTGVLQQVLLGVTEELEDILIAGMNLPTAPYTPYGETVKIVLTNADAVNDELNELKVLAEWEIETDEFPV